MLKKKTIYDVARRANVAISTVSRVINNSHYVSTTTRKRVEKAIKDLEFRPQVNARKLARREPQVIAAAVPTFTIPFFNEILKGVRKQLFDSDLDFVIYDTGSAQPLESFKIFLDRGIPDALLLFFIPLDKETIKRLTNTLVPLVVVGFLQKEFHNFYWNNYKGGHIAGTHLVDQGFTKIGMVRSHSKSPFADEREKGFRKALMERNIEINEDFFVRGITRKHIGYSEEAGYEAIQILKKRGKFPEAIFCTNDTQAIGVMHALKEINIRIPEDIAILGSDNIKTAQYLGLSSIDQKLQEVGMMAIQQLIAIIKKKNDEPFQQEIIPELIVRKSTQRQ